MCFRLGSCFGGSPDDFGGSPDDFGGAHSSTPKVPRGGRKGGGGCNRSRKEVGTAVYDHVAAGHEAWRKTYHDAPRDVDGHGPGYGYPAAHDNAYPAARNNNKKVGHDHYAGYRTDTDGTVAYHYPATTTTSLVRY